MVIRLSDLRPIMCFLVITASVDSFHKEPDAEKPHVRFREGLASQGASLLDTSLYHIGVSLQVKSQDFFERKRNKKFGKKTGLHNPVRFYLTKACAGGLQFMACKKDRESCRAAG